MGKLTKLFLVAVLLIQALLFVSCGDLTTSTIKLTETIDSFYSAVLLLENHATSVKIGFYDTEIGDPVLFEKNNLNFTELLQYLEKFSASEVTPRITTTIENGITETIDIIKFRGNIFLDFNLTDGITLRFTVADKVWFETADKIYSATYYGYGDDFNDFLESVLFRYFHTW